MAEPIANLNQFSAEEAGNMQEVEMQFVSAVEREWPRTWNLSHSSPA